MLSTSICTVTDEKRARGKRKDPNYAQLIGDVPKDIIQQFKINCLKKDMTIGEALTEAVKLWNEKIEGESND
jgi:hypothetical protein